MIRVENWKEGFVIEEFESKPFTYEEASQTEEFYYADSVVETPNQIILYQGEIKTTISKQ